MIILLSLLFQFQSQAADVIHSRYNPVDVERTAKSSDKIKVKLPVDFTYEKCINWGTRTSTCYAPRYYPCGPYGRYTCSYGTYPYPCSVSVCEEYGPYTVTETKTVVLKFKKGTELKDSDVEIFNVKAEQRHKGSSSLYISVEGTHTVQPYDVQFNGRRVVFRSKK